MLQPTCSGPTISVRPLLLCDWGELYDAASDPLIWEQHPNPLMYTEVEFKKYFEGGLESNSSLAVINNSTNSIIGTSRYYDINYESSSVSIGYTFLSRSQWGGSANKELKKLMIEHAFSHFDTVTFQIARDNVRSRKSIEKIGAKLLSEFKKVMYGRSLDYCSYSIAREGYSIIL